MAQPRSRQSHPSRPDISFGALREGLRRHWRAVAGYQRFLYIVGAVLIASAVFHTGVLIATGGTLEGDTSWRKPILFGEAFGITAISISWVMTYLPMRPRVGWLLAGVLGIANLGEVLWVSDQQWRGVPSHFNDDTALDEVLFLSAGVLIGFAFLVIIVVTIWAFVRMSAPSSMTLAIRAGLLLLTASQFFGLAMVLNDGNTIGEAGAMKVPHGLALHGLQILPILAGALTLSAWSERQRTGIVLIASVGYAGLVTVTAARAFAGMDPVEMGALSGAVITACVTILVAAGIAALRGMAQPRRQHA